MTDTAAKDAAAPPAFAGGRYRWVICGLLFTAVVINYVDRQMLGVLKPFISKELGWNTYMPQHRERVTL